MRPVPKRLVTVAARGRMKGSLHIGAVSCARAPISRAVALSLSMRACVSASRGRVKRGDTDNVRARAPRRAGFGLGIVTEARALSSVPEARSISTLASTSPAASTDTGPIARHVPVPDLVKCSGSPDIVPLILVTLSAADPFARSVNLTIAPGAGAAGENVRDGACA